MLNTPTKKSLIAPEVASPNSLDDAFKVNEEVAETSQEEKSEDPSLLEALMENLNDHQKPAQKEKEISFTPLLQRV
jgi:hypothetical protein